MSNNIFTTNTELTEIINHNPNVMLMLEHFGIPLPLQDYSINDVCNQYQINPILFLDLVHLYSRIDSTTSNSYGISDIPVLLKYLKNSHAYYLDEIYPSLLAKIKQMQALNNHKEIELVEGFFNDYFKEVKEHLDYENEIVFPYVMELYHSINHNKNLKNLTNYKVNEYKEHHSDIEEKLDDLKNLLIKYLPLMRDQQVRRSLVFSLFELDYDLKVHAKIEDVILIPLVEKTEQYLKLKA